MEIKLNVLEEHAAEIEAQAICLTALKALPSFESQIRVLRWLDSIMVEANANRAKEQSKNPSLSSKS